MYSPEIEVELQLYVQSAAMPCPYAKLPTLYVYLDGDVEAEQTRDQLKTALAKFWPDRSKSILSIIPRTEPLGHSEARSQAYWLRYHLHYLNLAEQGLIGCETDTKLKRTYLNLMSDPRSFLGPRVMVGKADIMMTAFNPLYDRVHPRYAPHTVLPIIRSKDLLKIHEQRPSTAFKIAVQAKCKLILSILTNRERVYVDEMRGEYSDWLDALSYYRDFVTTVYTDSHRIDPRTLPRLHENRRLCKEAMESERFKASLVAYRILVTENPKVPTLWRILDQNPEVTVFDVAKIVYGDVSGMYVLS